MMSVSGFADTQAPARPNNPRSPDAAPARSGTQMYARPQARVSTAGTQRKVERNAQGVATKYTVQGENFGSFDLTRDGDASWFLISLRLKGKIMPVNGSLIFTNENSKSNLSSFQWWPLENKWESRFEGLNGGTGTLTFDKDGVAIAATYARGDGARFTATKADGETWEVEYPSLAVSPSKATLVLRVSNNGRFTMRYSAQNGYAWTYEGVGDIGTFLQALAVASDASDQKTFPTIMDEQMGALSRSYLTNLNSDTDASFAAMDAVMDASSESK